MRGDGASDCSKTPEVEIGRSSEISNMFREGKGAVQDYAKVSNTGMKGKGGKSFCEQREVKLRKLLGSAEPDKYYCVLFGFSDSRLEGANLEKEHQCANKSE